MNLVHFHEYFAENLRDCLFVKTSEKVVNVVVVCDKGSCMLIYVRGYVVHVQYMYMEEFIFGAWGLTFFARSKCR